MAQERARFSAEEFFATASALGEQDCPRYGHGRISTRLT
jgi:hypothetical protein